MCGSISRRWWPATFLLLLPAPAEGGSTKSGKFFRVVCDFEDSRAAALALETAEAAWPVAARLFGSPDARPEKPLDINLFRTQAAYERADAEVSGGRFKENLCFASWKTRSAYLLLQPQCSDDALAVVGLPLLTRRLVAHEATHLVRYDTLPNHESHPGWLSHGAATWVEEEVLEALRLSPGRQKDPESATDIRRAVDLLARNQLPGARQILRDEMEGLEFYERYSVAGLFFRFLKDGKHRAPFEALLAEARRLGGGEGYSTRLFEFAEKTWGPEGFATLDREFAAFLRSMPPEWDQVFRSLELAGKDWIQFAFPDTNAIAWRMSSSKGPDYAISGEVEIWPGPRRQMNVLLARAEDGYFSVALVADYGVTAFRYHSKENRWEQLGDARVPGFETGKRTPFRVEVRAGRLEVTVGSQRALAVPLGSRETKGPWGLGAQAGSAGRWSTVRLRE